MHGDFAGVVLSVLLISLCIAVSALFKNKTISRKIVHIGVSNWYFIYRMFFTTWIYPVAGLVSFAALNYFYERKSDAKSWGTVEYPLVVSLMVILVHFGFGNTAALGCALLGMGYGDGLAAITGILFGKTKVPFNRNKTITGSLVCFAVVSAVVFLTGNFSIMYSLLVGLTAMLVEAYTPFNLDNITLPLVIFLLC